MAQETEFASSTHEMFPSASGTDESSQFGTEMVVHQ